MIGKKVTRGGFPHHSFHVLNVWRETTHELLKDDDWSATAECIVSWGKVVAVVTGPFVDCVDRAALPRRSGNILARYAVSRRLIRDLAAVIDIDLLAPGKWISIHWGVPCEVLSERAAVHLRAYTLKSIAFANQSAHEK
jgi:hypothetical protein